MTQGPWGSEGQPCATNSLSLLEPSQQTQLAGTTPPS